MRIDSQPIRQQAWFLLAILFLSLAEARIIFLVYDNINQHAQALYGIVIGEPHWKEYQNRLLGAYSTKLTADIFSIRYEAAYSYILIGLHVVKNLLFYLLAVRMTGNRRDSLLLTVCSAFLFLALQNAAWLYLWDYLDVIVFTLFVYGALARKTDGYFLLLFILALFNKESCLFIAAWLILDATLFKPEENRFRLRLGIHDASRLLTGVSLAVIGIIFVVYTRQQLMIQETAISANPEFALERPFHFARNLRTYLAVWSHPSLNFDILVNVFVSMIPFAPFALKNRLDDTLFKLILLVLIFFGSVLAFGLIHETRLYSLLIPISCFICIYLANPPNRTAQFADIRSSPEP